MQSGRSTSEDVVAPLAPSSGLRASEQQKQAAELVQEFYDAVNRRECDSIAALFAEDCVYEDLVFPKPFLGRKVKP
jgi:ketosteroid isomerase-like protein